MTDLPRVGGAPVRSRVRVNGALVQEVSWNVSLRGFGAASQATVDLAFKDNQTLPAVLGDPSHIPTPLTIEIGSPQDPRNPRPGELVSVFDGYVDTARYRGLDDTIELVGRDRTRLLIMEDVTDLFRNRTGSQIATLLAQKHNLTPIVTATTSLAGTYYDIDFARLPRVEKEWDLLLYLARHDDRNLYVKGTELHYEAYLPASQRPLLTYVWNQGAKSDLLDYEIEHSPLESHDFTVIVRSHHPKTTLITTTQVDVLGEVISSPRTKTLPAGVYSAAQSGGANTSPMASRLEGKPVYEFPIEGLTPQQTQDLALSLARQIAFVEYGITLYLTGTNAPTMQSSIQVRGIHPMFDRVYFPRTIGHDYDLSQGWRTTITGLSHIPSVDPDS